jgi:hypothetical protein
MTELSFDELVKRFDAISKAFGTGFMEPQLTIGMRHGWKEKESRFYASFHSVEIKGDGVLIGASESGSTPEEAMRNYYNRIVGETLVYHAMREDRKEVTVV